jgi:hypothetical protein
MCLVSSKQVTLATVEAFKIFTRDRAGRLRSLFESGYVEGLYYETGKRIRVNDEDCAFFAFADLNDAISFAMSVKRPLQLEDGRRNWAILSGSVELFSVTLHDVVAEGQFQVPSGDWQTMDAYLKCYEAQEIEVHPDQSDIHREISRQSFRSNFGSLSQFERDAFRATVPWLLESSQAGW